MQHEWHNAESFHALLVHLILPVVIIVVIVSFILKGCEPPELEEEDNAKAPAAESVRNPDAAEGKKSLPADASAEKTQKEAAPAVEAETQPVTAPEPVPQA
jgi:hypothetical protein